MGEKDRKEWRGGVYCVTAETSLEADILESKLRSEGIPCVKKYKGASNAMEVLMGASFAYPIDLYVPEECLEDAKNVVLAIPLLEDEDFDENGVISDEELERQALAAGNGEEDNEE